MKRKVTRRVTEEVEIKTVEIEIPIDEIAEHTPKIPDLVIGKFTSGEVWRIQVDVDTGRILAWPEGGPRLDLYCKPCDGGSYRLLAPDGKVVAAIEENYVPNLCIPGDDGDYIGLRIASNGVIENWPQGRDFDTSEFFKDDEDED